MEEKQNTSTCIYYTTTEELKEKPFLNKQNVNVKVINIDKLPLEKRQFIKEILDFVPEF